MKLSTRGRYGVRLMVELANNFGQGPISTSVISKQQRIPVKYLEQLIIPLKKAGLVDSVRGPKGGHMLSRPPEDISLLEILNLLETKISLADCINDSKICSHTDTCLVRPIWGKAYTAMIEIFQETTLEDVLNAHH